MARILVIDHVASDRVAIAAALRERHEVDEAGDGEAGRGLYDASPYDVVLLDGPRPRKGAEDTLAELVRAFPAIREKSGI